MEYNKAIKIAIQNVLKEGFDDIFPRPFEAELLKNKEFQKIVLKEVQKCLSGNSFSSLAINKISHVLLPKNSAFDFRKCALIQPLDLIKYNSLIISMAKDIELKRIPLNKKRVYSYRIKFEKGYIFNRNYHITSFQKRVREKAKKRNTRFIVSCDISNFYDRLNLHRLENTLLSIGCNKNKIKTLNELLLFWSNRDSYGLPVGSNGSRILAEASLTGIDNYLLDMKVDFIRFVDDYRLFAPDSTTAHYWLTILIERLWYEGLTINKSKTKIEASVEYKKNKLTIVNVATKESSETNDKNPFIIIAGYGGTVPNKFRELSEKEIIILKQKDIHDISKKILDNDFLNSDQIIEFMKVIVCTGKYDYIEKMLLSLDRYPQMTPYVVDAIIKNHQFIPPNILLTIKKIFITKLINPNYIPEYLSLSYIRLLGNENFYDKDVILKYFRKLRRNSGAYIGRAILDALNSGLTRENAIEIRNSYDRSDLWEKRQIVRLVKKYLSEEEKRPWLKNLKYIEKNDCFLSETITTSEKKKTKKKQSNRRNVSSES